MLAFGTPVGADYAVSKNKTDDEIGPNPVMLSTFATLSVNSAKHLVADRDRPFAALRVTVEGPIHQPSLGVLKSGFMYEKSLRFTVMLSTFATLRVNSAKHLAAQRDRPFAALRVTPNRPSLDVPLYS